MEPDQASLWAYLLGLLFEAQLLWVLLPCPRLQGRKDGHCVWLRVHRMTEDIIQAIYTQIRWIHIGFSFHLNTDKVLNFSKLTTFKV